MNETIDSIIAGLNRLYGLPAVALVFFSCIVVGYAVRFVKAIDNSAIPVVVILWGGLIMSLIADSRATSMSLRVWVVRNIMVGLIIGLIAWLVHNRLLSKLEDWLLSKLPNLGNTDFFKRKNGEEPPPKP